MTRREFIENITSWPELLEFCNDYDCPICEDVVDGDDLHSRISDDLYEYAFEYHWRDIQRWLADIVTGYRYYIREGSFEYTAVDDDFDDYKDYVFEWMDDNGCWDEEDDEDLEFDEDCQHESGVDRQLFQESVEVDDVDDMPIDEEDITIVELCSICRSTLQTIGPDDGDNIVGYAEPAVSFCSC